MICGGIHMSDIPRFAYADLWGERTLRSVANLTRRDGEELLEFTPKLLQKMLRKAGAEKPEAAAKAILQQRNRVSLGAKSAAGDALECPLCMEPYADDDERHVPRILQCGHTACQGCLSLMLRTAKTEAHSKKLECPECRKVTDVKQGKASNLQKNFGMLR